MISATDIRNAKVLIVDDQESGADLLKGMLEQVGHTDVTYTTNPNEVCELYRTNHYKAILLNLQLPGMSGFQLMQDLNAIEPDDYVPVIAITDESAYKLPALKAGAKDCICKPFDVDEVLTGSQHARNSPVARRLPQRRDLEILARKSAHESQQRLLTNGFRPRCERSGRSERYGGGIRTWMDSNR
jgi:DNA-binding response OmpR family regulator